MEPFNNVHLLGKHAYGDVWCRVNWDGTRLSFVGVVGPKRNGDCEGGAGQIVDTLDEQIVDGWPKDAIEEFAAQWRRWHLNDMRAGSPAQEGWKRRNRGMLTAARYDYTFVKDELRRANLDPDPETGYVYGTAWLTEEVPAKVLTLLCDATLFPLATTPCLWGNL